MSESAEETSAFIVGELSDHLGYTAMFPFVAAMFIIALLPLATLRVERSKAAVARAHLMEQLGEPSAG